MTTHHRQISNSAWRLFATIGGLLTGLFALGVCTQMVQPVFAAPAAEVVVQRTAATAAKGGAKVSIVNFAFTPGEITIAPGESVTWTNDDGAPHGLEYHDGAKGTDLLLPGASFSRRFDRPGTYDYNCSIHPYMTGRVVVRAQ
jgi:plastocyanin